MKDLLEVVSSLAVGLGVGGGILYLIQCIWGVVPFSG